MHALSSSPAVVTLTLHGPQISKKNNLRPRRGGGMYYDARTRALIDAYTWQARALWRDQDGKKEPLERFAYGIQLYNQKADPDGVVTTVLDCLKTAGVITDDAAKHAVRSKDTVPVFDNDGPRVVVTLERLS